MVGGSVVEGRGRVEVCVCVCVGGGMLKMR